MAGTAPPAEGLATAAGGNDGSGAPTTHDDHDIDVDIGDEGAWSDGDVDTLMAACGDGTKEARRSRLRSILVGKVRLKAAASKAAQRTAAADKKAAAAAGK